MEGDCELRLFAAVHHREGCRESATGTLSDDSYVAKCVLLRDVKQGSEGSGSDPCATSSSMLS